MPAVLLDLPEQERPGHTALKHAYHQIVGDRTTALIGIEHKPNGAPYIPHDSNLFCSLSHTTRTGLGIVAPYPVGADVETVTPRDDAVLPYITVEEERDFIADTPLGLTTAWTIKEAALKATEHGLTIPPTAVRITSKYKNTYDVHHSKSKNEWKARTTRYEDRIATVVWPRHEDEPTLHRYQSTHLPLPATQPNGE